MSSNQPNQIFTLIRNVVVADRMEKLQAEILEAGQLMGYPKSQFWDDGLHLFVTNHSSDIAFELGAEAGCVPCMFWHSQRPRDLGLGLDLVLPFMIECAIRGNKVRMYNLLQFYWSRNQFCLLLFWDKLVASLEDSETVQLRKQDRKETRRAHLCNNCAACGCKRTDETVLLTCEGCKVYWYCSKECQRYHWIVCNHSGECRQNKILRKYCKTEIVREIRDAIIRGEDPKTIGSLQKLRSKLGLNQPRENYENLVDAMTRDTNSEFKVCRKNGKLLIGSSPNAI
mgnify:CR=1 FL=1